MLQSIKYSFSEALSLNTYRVHRQSQKYNRTMFSKIAKRASDMDIQIKSKNLRTSNAISVFTIPHDLKTV